MQVHEFILLTLAITGGAFGVRWLISRAFKVAVDQSKIAVLKTGIYLLRDKK